MIFSAAKCPACKQALPEALARQMVSAEAPLSCPECGHNLSTYLSNRAMVLLLARSALVGIGIPALFGGIAAWWLLR